MDTKKRKEVYYTTEEIKVNNVSSDLVVTMDWDVQNGTWKISTTITTKQMTLHDNAMNDLVLSNLTQMLAKSVQKMNQMREKHLAQIESAEPKLPFEEAKVTPIDEPVKRKRGRPKKVTN